MVLELEGRDRVEDGVLVLELEYRCWSIGTGAVVLVLELQYWCWSIDAAV